MTDVSESGFKEVTRVADARARLHEAVTPHGRPDRVPLRVAEGRALAEPVDAVRNVPHYARAAMDGWAVRAEDTFGATRRSPVRLERSESVGPNAARRVHTGSELPEGADAVVRVEQVEADDYEYNIGTIDFEPEEFFEHPESYTENITEVLD